MLLGEGRLPGSLSAVGLRRKLSGKDGAILRCNNAGIGFRPAPFFPTDKITARSDPLPTARNISKRASVSRKVLSAVLSGGPAEGRPSSCAGFAGAGDF